MTRPGPKSARIMVNGVRLNVEISGSGPPLLLLHGFTGSVATWKPFRHAWRGFTLIAVDLLGHGRSDSPDAWQRYSADHCVADLLAVLDALAVQRTSVLGYSMGGRIALHLAVAAPERVWALVLEGSSPGIEDARERAARRESDWALAEAVERDGVMAFVDRWQELPLFASQARLPEAARHSLRRQRLRNNPIGLANSLRGMGVGVQQPLWADLPKLAAPTLLLVGAEDHKYRCLAHRMATLMPNARAVVVPGAGHAVHLEQPETFASEVEGFLRQCGSPNLSKEVAPCP